MGAVWKEIHTVAVRGPARRDDIIVIFRARVLCGVARIQLTMADGRVAEEEYGNIRRHQSRSI